MDQQMHEFRVTSCCFGKTVEEVERRRFVKLKRYILEPAARGIVSNALRLENQQKSIRQRFAFTLKDSADGLCDDLKPADSYSYLESAGTLLKDNQQKIEKMKVKKHQVRANHVECHQKFQARIHEAEDSMKAQHLLIEALVDEKDSLLQTIHGLQEANNAPAPFDGDWEEEPEEEPKEEEIEDIPLGEGEIDDE
ncbi:DNA topoisomerase 1 [Dorcoceras hygrometricum]|uniref:DNA topoisomerase 1 n=1 Tax=Dorcoceras hygrometricum TaxID=472368 RepID=A0A2Z7CAX6_9LAMI|nr:DNA topoisomerase 1 [Dorcoceras hygrometricum]